MKETHSLLVVVGVEGFELVNNWQMLEGAVSEVAWEVFSSLTVGIGGVCRHVFHEFFCGWIVLGTLFCIHCRFS